jgi:hypothetical protein
MCPSNANIHHKGTAMNLRTLFVAFALGAGAAGAFAQTAAAAAASTPGVDARQQRQEARIQQGAASAP